MFVSGCEVTRNEHPKVIQCFFRLWKSHVMQILRLYNVFSGCEINSNENPKVIQRYVKL